MAFGVPALQDHPTPYAAAMERGLVRAKCLNVVDGDTYDFLLDLGWYQYTYGRVRLRGADTPELKKPTLEAGRAAEARAAELLLDRHSLVRTHKGEKSFDRFIADVWVPALEWTAPEGVPAIGVPPGDAVVVVGGVLGVGDSRGPSGVIGWASPSPSTNGLRHAG